MNIDQRIQYHKDKIKQLETYTPSYTIDYFKVLVLLAIVATLIS